MSTTGIDASTLAALNGQPAATAATTKIPNDQIDQKEFLTLFLAQLQNQDPLSPMDPEQMTSQLAQLSSLEQLTGMNQKLDQLASATKQDMTTTLVGMIGKHVRFDASQLAVADGRTSQVAYTLGSAASDVQVRITTADGTVVRTAQLGSLPAGAQTYAWDGRDDGGKVVPDGSYTAHVTATIGGQRVGVAADADGAVDGVDLSADPPVLLVAGSRLTLDRIREVRD